MKKPLLIFIVVLSVLLFVIYSAVLWDTARRHNSVSSNQPVTAAPAPQVQNLQAVNQPAPVVPAPNAAVPVGNIPQLVAQLADPDPNVRAQAQIELEKVGQPALAEIQQARLNHADPEVRARCNELVLAITGQVEAKQAAAALAGGGEQIIERRAFVGPDGQMKQEEIVKDLAGNILQRRQIVGGNAAPAPQPLPPVVAAPRRQPRAIHVPPGMDPVAAQAFVQAQQAQQNAFAQLDAMRAQRDARNAINRPQEDEALRQRRQALQQQQMEFQKGLPPPPAMQDFSLNLLDTFGAKLTEADGGLRVVEVKPDSSAAKAGLAVGDLITAVNNRQTVKAEDIKIALGAALDKPLRVEVTRKGEAVTLEAAKP